MTERESCIADALLGDDPATSAQRHAFMSELFGHDWAPALHAAALFGWVMRIHVDQCHPGDARDVERLTLEKTPPAHHEAWRYGYNWRENRPA